MLIVPHIATEWYRGYIWLVYCSYNIQCQSYDVKLYNYSFIVSARTIVWIWMLYLKEGRHYSVFEEVILLAVLSVLFLCIVLNIGTMKFRFYFLVVIFHWTDYTMKVQMKVDIFSAPVVVFEEFTLDISVLVWWQFYGWSV
jgi:hypothetical protein